MFLVFIYFLSLVENLLIFFFIKLNVFWNVVLILVIVLVGLVLIFWIFFKNLGFFNFLEINFIKLLVVNVIVIKLVFCNLFLIFLDFLIKLLLNLIL